MHSEEGRIISEHVLPHLGEGEWKITSIVIVEALLSSACWCLVRACRLSGGGGGGLGAGRKKAAVMLVKEEEATEWVVQQVFIRKIF